MQITSFQCAQIAPPQRNAFCLVISSSDAFHQVHAFCELKRYLFALFSLLSESGPKLTKSGGDLLESPSAVKESLAFRGLKWQIRNISLE